MPLPCPTPVNPIYSYFPPTPRQPRAAECSAEDSDSAGESEDFSEFSSQEGELEGEEEEQSLSEEDLDAIESLLDIPPFAGTEVQVTSWENGSVVGMRSLEPSVFGVPVRRDVVHDVIRWQLARRRSGNGNVRGLLGVLFSTRSVFVLRSVVMSAWLSVMLAVLVSVLLSVIMSVLRVHHVILWQLARRRSGNGEVRGLVGFPTAT